MAIRTWGRKMRRGESVDNDKYASHRRQVIDRYIHCSPLHKLFHIVSTSPSLYSKMPSNKDRLYVALYARGGAPTMPGKEDT
jgi:hypothetical protein